MNKQIAFIYNGEKYVTLLGAGQFMKLRLISPKSNVGLFEACCNGGNAVLFQKEFDIYPSDVPVLEKMSVCKQDDDGAFVVHGSYMENGKQRDVSLMKDKLVFHKSYEEREAESVAARIDQREAGTFIPYPGFASFVDEPESLDVDLNADFDSVPEPPISDTPTVESVLDSESQQTDEKLASDRRVIGRRRKKGGIKFGPTITRPVTDAPIVTGENVLSSFPGNKPKDEVPNVVVLKGENGNSASTRIVSDDVRLEPNNERPIEALTRITSGMSAMEALTGNRVDIDTMLPGTIKALAADKLECLGAVPISMLQMTSAFVPHRTGINFDELKADGSNYAQTHGWEEIDDWFCCDALDTATRVFYNQSTGEVSEFKSSECSAMYEKRRLMEV